MNSPLNNESQQIKDNLAYNQKRWGDRAQWESLDSYGYNWSQMHGMPSYTSVSRIATEYLIPWTQNRYDLSVLEIAPGAGRFTAELLRIAKELSIVDMNQACIEICKERFRYYLHISYFVNDGMSLNVLPDRQFDLVSSWDSFVHIEPAIIQAYLREFHSRLVEGGIVWLHHSASGERKEGHRTAMTDSLMRQFAEQCGYDTAAQYYLGSGKDCISVLRRR